jgi:beta-galactosidase
MINPDADTTEAIGACKPVEQISRRTALKACVSATAALPLINSIRLTAATPAPNLLRGSYDLPLNADWQFTSESLPTQDVLTLPHCVSKLSWQKWNPADWEKIWTYRREFAIPREFGGHRVFLHFERAIVAAAPVLNDQKLAPHKGGFLPFHYEVTGLLANTNVLAISLDSRWLNVPPGGSAKGPASIDYLLPGGITGSVFLRAVPQVFISDVYAKPVDVLTAGRRLELHCLLDAGVLGSGSMTLEASLEDGGHVVSRSTKNLSLKNTGQTEIALTLTGLKQVKLWDLDSPHLYEVVVRLLTDGHPLHEYRTRTGFREARFALDGFFLNGRRTQIFGLNRHELYPYVGFAMPSRVLRKDAEILRHELNCNTVRCSHYPQSEAFLDACDELGLLVWEEIPGWQFIGDDTWQDLALRDVKEMVRRDRNHPSVFIWGVRINESHNDPALYRQTKKAAKSLDDTRPTSGSMVHHSTENWLQDVFAYDDYHSAPDGSVGLVPPLPGVPFFFSEAVGQFSYDGRGFNNKYRRARDVGLQQKQALYHAQVHDRAAADPRYAGVIAWCGFEYGSLLNDYDGVKYPGVVDFFRIPKLGASFYKSQINPKKRSVIEPNFYWDFEHQPSGPGKDVAIFSNLERLELIIGDRQHSVLSPDRTSFPHLRYPPFFADLVVEGSKPELRIDGYIDKTLVLSRSFSADSAADKLWLQADDAQIARDESDATRIAFGVTDKFGAPRLFAQGPVTFSVEGPGVLVGDNPFDLTETGGMGALWLKAKKGGSGLIRIHAQKAGIGAAYIQILV